MIKVVTTLKRKAGLSTANFREYYENNHRLIGEKYLRNYAARYVRRYLNPQPDSDGNMLEPDVDVLLEIWFENEERLQACGARLSEPEVAREILIDEEQLFDRSSKRSYVVEEFESQLPGQSAAEHGVTR